MKWDPYYDSYSAAESRQSAAVNTLETLPGEKDRISVPPKDLTALQGDINHLYHITRVCATQRVLPPELKSESINLDRIVSAVNIATDDKLGDGTCGWNDTSVSDHVSPIGRSVMAMASTNKRSILTKEILAKRWGCGLETAKKTLQCTTQYGIRHVIHPYDKRYRTTFDHLRFLGLRDKYYSDTLFNKKN